MPAYIDVAGVTEIPETELSLQLYTDISPFFDPYISTATVKIPYFQTDRRKESK